MLDKSIQILEFVTETNLHKLLQFTLPKILCLINLFICFKFQTWGQRCLGTINKTFDFNMFTEFHFLMMNLSTLVLFIWFIVPYFYISNFMTMNGYSEIHGTWMLSIFGIATIVGIVSIYLIIHGKLPARNVTKLKQVI